MSAPLRSTGWSVSPSFTPHAATSGLTLLFDEVGLTQLAGDPPVAWQTPWSEISNVELVRSRRKVALGATIGAVRYTWTTTSLADCDELAAIVVEHAGGVERRRSSRGAIIAVAVIVLVASLTGGIGAWLNRSSTSVDGLAGAKAINLTQEDLPDAFAPLADASVSPLSAISVPSPTHTPSRDSRPGMATATRPSRASKLPRRYSRMLPTSFQ